MRHVMTLSPVRDLNPVHEISFDAAFRRALRIFHEAAEHVPAYKDFLKRMGVRHTLVRTKSDFAQVPETDKLNYFSKYSLDELSWGGTLTGSKYVSTSSGSTGVPFFWPRGDTQDEDLGHITRHIWRDIFGTQRGSTLFVNAFSLGTWIAGMEFYNAVRWNAEHGTNITLASPGIDTKEAVTQIKKLAPLFSRIIIASYPPFVKDILDVGAAEGIDWKKLDLYFFFGGEAVSELWKDKLLARVGQDNANLSRVVNVYGMAEAGLVAHDTPVSTLFRRMLPELHEHTPEVPDAVKITGVYQYYPRARYFETTGSDSLLLTANAGLPLIRYSTRDNGGLISITSLPASVTRVLATRAKELNISLSKWQLPIVYLYGRKDLSLSFYALMLYVENIKYALERSHHERLLSGLFTMHVDQNKNLDQELHITIELDRGVSNKREYASHIAAELTEVLPKINSEYGKLYAAIGDRAKPKVTVVTHGKIQTTPGRKHRWVKRDSR